jgi:hypothetical protein
MRYAIVCFLFGCLYDDQGIFVSVLLLDLVVSPAQLLFGR